MLKMLKGKRTYVTMVVILVLGLIDSWNKYCGGEGVIEQCKIIEIPGGVFAILSALGIYTRKLANTDK